MAAALLLIVGGSIALASQTLDRGGPDASAGGAPRPPAPTLLGPLETLTRSDLIDLDAIRPSGLRTDQNYRLRLFVNDDLVREEPLPAQELFPVTDIPLFQGMNAIRLAVVGDGGEGPRSAPVSITRDDIEPLIRITRPVPDEPVYSPMETLRGRTEAGADMSVVDLATGVELETELQADGRFETSLTLAPGDNTLLLRSRDAAGNVARARIVIVLAENRATLSLTITPGELVVAGLPDAVDILALIEDELGRPAEGAQVTFSVSPPNRATMTYRTMSVGGRASWVGLEIVGGGDSVGRWLVTVLATLPSGMELFEDDYIIVR